MRKLPAAALVSALTLVGCTIPPETDTPRPTETVWVTPAPQPHPTELPPPRIPSVQAAVDRVLAQYGGEAEVAVFDGVQAQAAGAVHDAPAWSTIKIPLAVAALRRDPGLADTVRAAVTVSDNQAADQLWASLGTPAEAGAATGAVLAEAGVHTEVQFSVAHPEFSSYGQTRWTPADQARFAAALPCLAGAEPVLAAMEQISPGQDYGLGTLPGARYKGGWGPGADGRYVVRQFGLLPAAGGQGMSAVALVVRPASGLYADGQAMLTELAGQLTALPTVDCRTLLNPPGPAAAGNSGGQQGTA